MSRAISAAMHAVEAATKIRPLIKIIFMFFS